MSVNSESSAYDIIADLVRSAFVNNIGHADHKRLVLAKSARDVHSFDFNHLTEQPNQRKLAEKAFSLWYTVGLKPPFPSCSFLFRGIKTVAVSVITTNFSTINISNFIRSIDGWFNEYNLEFERKGENDILTQAVMDTSVHLPYVVTSNSTVPRFEIDAFADKFLNTVLLPAFALLAEKSDTVWIEPAEWTHVDGEKLKGYQRPPPSVSVVKLNTDRIMRPPVDDDGSGLTIRPHDRRAHLRRRGNKLIQVRSSKIHGGALVSSTKILKLERPLS